MRSCIVDTWEAAGIATVRLRSGTQGHIQVYTMVTRGELNNAGTTAASWFKDRESNVAKSFKQLSRLVDERHKRAAGGGVLVTARETGSSFIWRRCRSPAWIRRGNHGFIETSAHWKSLEALDSSS